MQNVELTTSESRCSISGPDRYRVMSCPSGPPRRPVPSASWSSSASVADRCTSCRSCMALVALLLDSWARPPPVAGRLCCFPPLRRRLVSLRNIFASRIAFDGHLRRAPAAHLAFTGRWPRRALGRLVRRFRVALARAGRSGLSNILTRSRLAIMTKGNVRLSHLIAVCLLTPAVVPCQSYLAMSLGRGAGRAA
jgi:hypothetical protein